MFFVFLWQASILKLIVGVSEVRIYAQAGVVGGKRKLESIGDVLVRNKRIGVAEMRRTLQQFYRMYFTGDKSVRNYAEIDLIVRMNLGCDPLFRVF